MSEYQSKEGSTTIIRKSGELFIGYANNEYKYTKKGRWFRLTTDEEWIQILEDCMPEACINACNKYVNNIHQEKVVKLIEAEKLRRQAEIKIRDIIDNLEKQTGLNVAVYGSNKEGARVDLELRVK